MGGSQRADEGWDTYSERVLRNEGRLEGLESLVRETRAADALLIKQRSDSLDKELHSTAHSLQELMDEQRAADQTEFRAALESVKAYEEAIFAKNDRRLTETLVLMRSITDRALEANADKSDAKTQTVADHLQAVCDGITQQMLQWRETDKEARDLLNHQNEAHFERLNHSHERQQEFQANSVTRELWAQSEQASRDKIAALEVALLGMTPMASSEAAHAAIQMRIEDMGARLQKGSEERMSVLTDKINDIKEIQAKNDGKSSGYQSLYGWAIAGFTLLVGVIVAANAILGH